jgi:integrase
LSYLSSIIKWAEDPEIHDPNPPLIEPGTVKIKLYHKKQTKRQKPIEPHTMEETAAIIAKLGNASYAGKNCNVELHEQMARDRYGLVLLMYDAGLRKKEARLLEPGRVNLPSAPIENYYGTITVIRKGGRVQTLPILTERLYFELKERMKTANGYLYISPLTGNPYVDIREGIKRAAKAAGVSKRSNPHLFRHDFVTHLHEMGADPKTIQELAGHLTLSTTMEIYTHLSSNTLRSRAAGFADAINKSVRTRTELKVLQGGKNKGESR